MTDPDVPPEFPTGEGLITVAHGIRTYYLALTNEGFDPSQALILTVAWQTSLLQNTDKTPISAIPKNTD